MKAMHRARAKKYYAKKKTEKQAPEEPPEPSEASESSSEASDAESDCSVKRRRVDSDVIIPYRDIKRALKEEKEKGGSGAGYAAAAVGGVGVVSAI